MSFYLQVRIQTNVVYDFFLNFERPKNNNVCLKYFPQNKKNIFLFIYLKTQLKKIFNDVSEKRALKLKESQLKISIFENVLPMKSNILLLL